MDQNVLWKPTAEFVQNSNLLHFLDWLTRHKGLTFVDYASLWRWTVENLEDFWESIWDYFAIIAHTPYEKIRTKDPMPEVEWFPGASLNYAEHIFRQFSKDRPALEFIHESGVHRIVGWNELQEQVIKIRAFLRQQGITKGDRVAGFLPNIPETVAIFLAVNSLGAIWSCCSPDFGERTVIDRFSLIEPKVLFTVDGYQYGGKAFPRYKQALNIVSQVTSIDKVVVIPYLDLDFNWPGEMSYSWNTVMDQPADQPIAFTPVPFDHPIWVLYSSGTTGKPKAITHSHGGMLLEHLKYLSLQNNVKPGERFFWFTTTGWMMWNFLQASMLVGAVPVLYDGSPGYPDLNALWRIASRLPIHHFGTSAPYLVACMKADLHPGEEMDLSALVSIGSTGAPLPPEAFDWVYGQVSEKVWLCSMSGGTDVCTAFVGSSPILPVYRGYIQCRALGCALYAYDEQGASVTGSLGEMVIEEPMPSMPIYFWKDPEGERYRSSYFEEYPGKWRHGDWIRIEANGSLQIFGRSDATLNRKGVRIGTAEIYRVLDGFSELRDALVLNIELPDGGDFMPLYIVLAENQILDSYLIEAINQALKTQCSPRHIPDRILVVPDIPYTLSGKKMEVPLKKILMGMDPGKALNKDAARNPAALEWFVEHKEQLSH